MSSHDSAPYDWAKDAVLAAALAPRNLPAVVPPIPGVVHNPGQQPYYAHTPAVVHPYDPLPQRMMGCGVMAFGILAGAGVAEAGSYLMFAGLSLATHAVIGIAATVASGAVAVVALRISGGVRITNFHQGDNSTWSGR
jgi:hypothetical protein